MMRRIRFFRLIACLIALTAVCVSAPARADRLRDLCDVLGVRDNQLIGYAVVTGLQGTGDDVSAPFAAQSLLALMRRLGVQVDSQQIRLRNVAAVVVTTNIPAFSRPGTKLDVTVSSIGNSRSLQGGVLLQALLYGADSHVYAVAQGPVVLGGFEAKGASGSSVRSNITTTGRIPNGAIVEREIPTVFIRNEAVTLSLREADFRTVNRIVTAIDKEFGAGTATALDGGAVSVRIPAALKGKPVELVAKLNDIDVSPAMVARVVINERTGTIVAGGDVRLAPVAIAHGGITIVIKETPQVSQPVAAPLIGNAAGKTVVVPRTEITPIENTQNPTMTFIDGAASLADVSNALSTLGVTPRELASILQALRSAGALRAEIVMQ